MKRRLSTFVFLAGLLATLAGCGPGGPSYVETVDRFTTAVQSQDLGSLYCLMAGAAAAEELGGSEAERRSNFDSWALAQYDAYLEGRDEGWVDLDEQGVRLVKLFALGRGTYFESRFARSGGNDVKVLRSEVRFGYSQVDLSGFSPGTTFYMCGAPVGRVHAVRVPSDSAEFRLDVLSGIEVEWTLVRQDPTGPCPGGWAVASVSPVEGTEQTSEITWVF